MQRYDRIVIGLGGIGTAALDALARRGIRALGIEQFQVGHDRGSSHGQTRIIRQAYFEHPNYVPLLKEADRLWCQLQDETGEELFRRTGLIEVGPPDGIVLPGVALSARTHNLPVEWPDITEVARRFPGFRVPDGMQVVFEPTAGLLFVERCVEAHARRARQAGAEIVCGQAVRQIDELGREFVVHTSDGVYGAESIILCAGAWSPALSPQQLPLRVVRKHLHWFACGDPSMQLKQDGPVFFFELEHGCFYGFPAVDELGVKVAEHTGGEAVNDPTLLDPAPDPRDDARVLEFLRRCLPTVSQQRRRHAVCMYTLTPDDHFVIDRHPGWPRAVIAAGLSGHGFKFAPVLGEILADLSCQGATSWDIDFLSADRFS